LSASGEVLLSGVGEVRGDEPLKVFSIYLLAIAE
jgi:hypothetical protein